MRQKWWGVLLAYNLLRSQMVKMAASQLSFHMASLCLIHELSGMPYMSPGTIPKRVAEPEKQAGAVCTSGTKGAELPPLREAKATEVQCEKVNKNNASQA